MAVRSQSRPSSPSRIAVVLLALSLAVGALVAVPAPAPAQVGTPVTEPVTAGSQPYAVMPGTVTTTTGPADAEIPVTLDYDIYVPVSATAATPQPAIVVAHGFGGDKGINEMITLAALFASNGYVVLASSHQGFGGSSGCIALDSVLYDGRNVSSLIDVLADRPDVLRDAAGDPVVGMIGGSYGGGHQAGVTAIDPRLDAMSPGRTWNSLQYSLVPNNRVTTGMWDLDAYDQGVFKQGWSSLFFALGQTQPLMGNGGCDPISQQALFPGQPPCLGFLPAICPLFARLAGTGDVEEDERALIRTSAASAFLDDVDIPVLLTQGQSDTLFTATEALATYEGLRARGVDARVLLNDGGHGYLPQPGEGEPYAGTFDDTPESQATFARTTFARRYLGFFGHHLRGEGDLGPRVTWFRDWVEYDDTAGNADAAYDSADDRPAGVRAFVLDAHGGGGEPALRTAQTSASTIAEATTTIINPPNGSPAAHSETPNFSGPGQPGASRQPSEVPGQHVAFTSAELDEPLESVGVGTVRVHVDNANGQDAVLFAKLYDVDRDGNATLIRRMVTAVRVPADELPSHVLIRLPPIVHRFDDGHRVQLVLSTTDDSYRNATVADQITLTTGGTQAVLLLPAAGDDLLIRVAGRTRVETAAQLSMTAFPDGAPAAVLAAAGDFPDALSAGGLAAALDGPLLLTDGAALPDRVLQELRRLDPSRIVLAGGTAVVGPAVERALRDAGFSVDRLAGPDRFATAATIAAETARVRGGVDRVVLARGDTFVDALAAGSLAATGAPVLLVGPDAIPPATRAALDAIEPDEVYLAGGEGVIPAAVAATAGFPTTRLGGATRYETAAALHAEARRFVPLTPTLLLASGTAFPDALAAAPAAHALGGLLMITDPADVEASPPAEQVIADTWTTAYLVGGYAALGQRIDGQVGNLIGAVR